MKSIILILLLPLQVISQDLPAGFVNFLIPRINKNSNKQSVHYRLYTDSTCSDKSYYGHMNYELYNDSIYLYDHLVLYPKDSFLKPEKIIPSIGYEKAIANTPRSGMTDTIYDADEESFFTVVRLENDRLCFSLNDKLNFWVKITETVKFYPPIAFLNNEYPFEVKQLGQIVLPESIKFRQISLSDSLALSKIAIELIEAFKNKETEKIKNNSLALIHDQLCCYNLIIPLDSFINVGYKNFDYFLFESLKKRGIKISEMVMPNFHPKYLPNNYEKDHIVFEARVMTYDPNDLNATGDGLNYCFYFVKINHNFKFFLFNCIPK